MKSIPKFLLALAFAFSFGADARAQEVACGRLPAEANNHGLTSSSNSCLPEPSGWNNHIKVTRFTTRFDGDHSLEAMAVGEQLFARYSLYTVRLQFASGAEQSLAVTAPPGGLRPEMRDMSGDNVPNDVVLTSGLRRLPVIVLLNEGHDHLTVAISPGSFSSGDGRASRSHQTQRVLALPSSRFKSSGLAKYGELYLSQSQGSLLSPVGSNLASRAAYAHSSERAPPILLTQI